MVSRFGSNTLQIDRSFRFLASIPPLVLFMSSRPKLVSTIQLHAISERIPNYIYHVSNMPLFILLHQVDLFTK